MSVTGDHLLSVEEVRSRFVPVGRNKATSRQITTLEHMVGSDGVLQHNNSYSTFWNLRNITSLTDRDAADLISIFSNRKLAPFIYELFLQMKTGVFDTTTFQDPKNANLFEKYMKGGMVPLLVYYLDVARIK